MLLFVSYKPCLKKYYTAHSCINPEIECCMFLGRILLIAFETNKTSIVDTQHEKTTNIIMMSTSDIRWSFERDHDLLDDY